MTSLTPMTEYRPDGTRNFIRVGDIIKVKFPRKDALLARLTKIEGEDGKPVNLTITIWAKCNGKPHGHQGKWRIVQPEMVTRVDQKLHAALRSDHRTVAA